MKLLVRSLLILVALIGLLGVGVALFVDSLVEQAVERGGSYALGVETRLGSASIGLVSGHFVLEDLEVRNPPGFASEDFLRLGSGRLDLPLSSLLSDKITIPALALEGIQVDLERSSKGTNYGIILDSLGRLESEHSEGPSGSSGEPDKTFLVQEFVIRDVRADVNLVPAGGELTRLSLTVPEIRVRGLDTEKTLPELCSVVVRAVVKAVVDAGADQLPDDLVRDLHGRLEGLEGVARGKIQDQLGGLEEALKAVAGEGGPGAGDAIERAGAKVEGKLDGLLKGKKKN